MGISSNELNKGQSGRDFEKDIESTFVGYSKGDIARLAMMPTPTRQIGSRNGLPIMIRSGKPPFDVYGYRVRDGVMIGAELKASQRKNGLTLVAPDAHGDGLQFHQLDALASLARCGGVSRLVWNNGGEIGVLLSDNIMIAAREYEHVLKTKLAGKAVPRGSGSIPWERFEPVEYTNLWGVVGFDWLMVEER